MFKEKNAASTSIGKLLGMSIVMYVLVPVISVAGALLLALLLRLVKG